jgi:hypothetical protein
MTLRPNPPRMITVIIAVALLAIGVAGVFLPGTVQDLIRALPLGADLTKQLLQLANNETVLYLCALAGPLLLAIGSLLPGI